MKKWADKPAIWFLDSWVTYGQLKDLVDRFATALANIGLKKGDVLAMILPNCIQYVVAYYAATSIGVIPSGINPTYKPLEVLHQIRTINAQYLLTLDSLYVELFEPIEQQWPMKKVIYTNIVDLANGLSPIKKVLGKLLKKIPSGKVNHPNKIPFKYMLKTVPNPPKVGIDPENDTATYIMSGGTTGVPKAVILTHQNVVSNAMQVATFLLGQKPEGATTNLGPQTGNIGVIPFFHSFAHTLVMLATIAVGGYMVLFPKPPPAEELLKEIERLPDYNGFIYCGAEILFQRIAMLPDEVLARHNISGKIKLCVSSAGPLHDYVRDPFEKKTGAKLTEVYGLTEASPGLGANNFYGERETGYLGVPIPGVDWAIFPADDAEFSKGPIKGFGEEFTGEICATGPNIMKGYLNRETEELKESGGKTWLLTGDIGYMEQNGRIAMRDRKKQLIKMAGHSIFPREVEELLGNHPAIQEVAVAGIPDEKLGEAVKAWVALKPDAVGKVTPAEILKWGQDNITGFKVPKYIDIVADIPKNAIGKVMRRTLQEADPLWQKAQAAKKK